jgi:hypothetical protein
VLPYGYDEDFRRQMILCTADEHLLDRVVSLFYERLGLAEMPAAPAEQDGAAGASPVGGHRVVVRSFDQTEGGVSRKRIEPLLCQILEGV